MVTKSIILQVGAAGPSIPPNHTPRVSLEHEFILLLESGKSPKSCASPVVAKVT